MIKNNRLYLLKNNSMAIFSYAFMNFQTDIINFIINLISISFYIVIFATILNKQVTNYLQFLLPGLIIINLLSAISYQALKIWSLGSTSKLMSYWLSLPHSLNFLLLTFSFMAIFSSLMYTLPIILVIIYLHFTINFPLWILLIFSSSLFLFYINFVLVLYFFKTNSFVIVFNVSQPLLLRISPVFYPLIYLPIFALPLSYLNPVTWIVESLRGGFNLIIVITFLIFLDSICYKILLNYWKKKIQNGELV